MRFQTANNPENAPSTHPWMVRLLPSLNQLAFAFPLLFLLFHMDGLGTLLGDGDTGWHIRTGEWILRHRAVPHTDMFSFSKAGQPWIAWEWLWDASMALVHQYFAMAGVIFLHVCLLGTVSAMLLRRVRANCPNPFIALGFTILAMAGSSIHWLARPHIVTWLFVLIFLGILRRAAASTTLLYSLPALMILWTNLHGGFFVGIALVACFAIDPLFRAAACESAEDRPKHLRAAARLLICSLGCLAATLVNPYGWELHRHVIEYLLDTRQLAYISEFNTLSFQAPYSRYFEIMLLLGVPAAFWVLRKGRLTDAGLILVWAHLGLIALRNIPIFMLFSAPIVARIAMEGLAAAEGMQIAAWLRKAIGGVHSRGASFDSIDRLPRLPVLPLAAFALLALLIRADAATGPLRMQYDATAYPEAALKTLSSERLRNVLTDDEWGDFVIYRMHPAAMVFVDGRSDFYGTQFEDRYVDIFQVKSGWEGSLSRYPVDAALLRTESPLAAVLRGSRAWKIVYTDKLATIFRPCVDRTPPPAERISSSNPGRRNDL